MFHTSYIEISKSALIQNLKYLKKKIGSDTVFSSVIKANAYGHSIELFVPLAEECGIDHFSVFSADEALRAHQVICNKKTRIMIMGMIENDELSWAIENDIEFFVFEKDRLLAALESAKKIGKAAKIHIELETGMNRTGFDETDLKDVAKIFKDNKNLLHAEGLCTHFAGAESVANYLRIQNQIKRFKKNYNKLKRLGLVSKYLHAACSAAAMNYKDSIMDMVRIGIAQYGLWPNNETYMKNLLSEKKNHGDPLKRVLSWKSKVMGIKYVEAGEFIGYGTSFLTNRKSKIASIPVGYSHGFGRNLSNLGNVLISGKRVPVIGLVNMNMIVVDVSSIHSVHKGDEVVIIGKQKKQHITVNSFSELSSRVNYEMLTHLPLNIPRILVD